MIYWKPYRAAGLAALFKYLRERGDAGGDVLTGVAAAPLLTVNSTRALQPGADAGSDPIFSVIARHRVCYAAPVEALQKNVRNLDALDLSEARALDAVVDTVPSTPRGMAALIAYVRAHRRERPEVVAELQDRLDATLLAALDRLAGAPLTTPSGGPDIARGIDR